MSVRKSKALDPVLPSGRSLEVLACLLNQGKAEQQYRFPALGEPGAQVQLDVSSEPRMTVLPAEASSFLVDLQRASEVYLGNPASDSVKTSACNCILPLLSR